MVTIDLTDKAVKYKISYRTSVRNSFYWNKDEFNLPTRYN
jgi:hypothetical protein